MRIIPKQNVLAELWTDNQAETGSAKKRIDPRGKRSRQKKEPRPRGCGSIRFRCDV